MIDWINVMQKAGNIFFVIPSLSYLADIIAVQGRLRDAIRTYQRSLQLASEHDKPALRMTANAHLGLGLIYHEQGNQEAAAQHMLKSSELGEQTELVDWPHRRCLAQARLRETWGDLEAALDLLDEAKRLYIRVPVPDIRPIEALKARVYVRQGRLTQALDWVHERGLSVDDDLSYLREFEHITLTRLLIAEYKREHAERSLLQAIGLLARLLKAAEEGRRIGSLIEILVLQALAHEAQGNIPLALAPLEHALALAEPEGHVRIFVDEGSPMEALLKRVKAEDERIRQYARKLLAAFGDKEAHPLDSTSPAGTSQGKPSPLGLQPLIEPLSERELEVLRLMAEGLTNQEIASGLFLSPNTVKVHTRNIYGKLDAHNRTQAAARARELGILSSA